MNLGSATLKSVTRESAPLRGAMECERWHEHGSDPDCAYHYDASLIAYFGEIGSRPEITRGISKQSVTASDDCYHSASDYASSSSSSDQPTAVRWATPPSQARSPDSSAQDNLLSEASFGRPAGRRERVVAPRSAIVETDEPRLSAAQVESLSRSGSGAATEGDISPPTPGIDDTPYIHYAIEQITRNDAEPIPTRRPTTGSSGSTYPVERIIPPGIVDPRPPQGGPPQQSIELEKRPHQDREYTPHIL